MPLDAQLRDYRDSMILPGLVDSHVHINEPGRAEWEGFDTATRAAAAGGVTTLVDMPLNCVPETIDENALIAKRNAARGKARADWATWGGVVRGNAEALKRWPPPGAGFKCFLIHSGIDGFAWVDEADLRLALEKLRDTGLPPLAHAEVDGPVPRPPKRLNAKSAIRANTPMIWRRGQTKRSRGDCPAHPPGRRIQTPIHIVHFSGAKALPLLAEARRRGVPITVETCVQYLWFAAERFPMARPNSNALRRFAAPPIAKRCGQRSRRDRSRW